jgi:hypothetical protein
VTGVTTRNMCAECVHALSLVSLHPIFGSADYVDRRLLTRYEPARGGCAQGIEKDLCPAVINPALSIYGGSGSDSLMPHALANPRSGAACAQRTNAAQSHRWRRRRISTMPWRDTARSASAGSGQWRKYTLARSQTGRACASKLPEVVCLEKWQAQNQLRGLAVVLGFRSPSRPAPAAAMV